MKIAIVSILPEMFAALRYGVIGRYITKGDATIALFNPRDFTKDVHRTVDDKPYGGGAGMLMCCEPLDLAIDAARDWLASENESKPLTLLMSPQGKTLNHTMVVEEFCQRENFIIVCGRFEGIDERLVQLQIDLEVSLGDFVVSGGEIPAMLLIDAIIRQRPNALGNAESVKVDSFVDNQLKYPQYTRPEVYKGLPVPDILLSGNHEKIIHWRRQQSIKRTAERRPDLIK